MKAYAIYELDGGRIVVPLSEYPKEWYSPLRHRPISGMTAEEHAAIYGVPAQHPEFPGYLFSGCVSGSDETEAARRSGYPFSGIRGSF